MHTFCACLRNFEMETDANSGFKLQNFIKIYQGHKIFSYTPASLTDSTEVSQVKNITGFLDSFHGITKSFYNHIFSRPLITVLIPVFFFMRLPWVTKFPLIFTAVFSLFHVSNFLRGMRFDSLILAIFYVTNPFYAAYFDALDQSTGDNHSIVF
ncbi:hypothetical protein MXB_3624 [Myxobolus squamalis]|nr:hypothetical protein MXB_3624 [Myxobolus squamalis]